MNRILLFAGGLLNLTLALFKIAMPYLFHWQEAMALSPASMGSTLYCENLAISMLLLFFACMSIFQWRELLMTGLGKTVLLSISALWIYCAAWVIFKWVGTLCGILVGSALLGPWQIQMVKLSSQPGTTLVTGSAYDLIRSLFTLVGLLQVVLLVIIVTISVRKPWGKRSLQNKLASAPRTLHAMPITCTP